MKWYKKLIFFVLIPVCVHAEAPQQKSIKDASITEIKAAIFDIDNQRQILLQALQEKMNQPPPAIEATPVPKPPKKESPGTKP